MKREWGGFFVVWDARRWQVVTATLSEVDFAEFRVVAEGIRRS